MLQDYVHRWWMPFAWITLSSLVGVPLSMYLEHGMTMEPGAAIGLAYGSAWVQRADLLGALMPYLLNLAAAVWLFSHDGTTRWAAFWATLVALARIIAPATLSEVSSVSAAGHQYVDWHALRFVLWFQDFEMFVLGVVVWGAFSRFAGNGSSATSHASYYAEA